MKSQVIQYNLRPAARWRVSVMSGPLIQSAPHFSAAQQGIGAAPPCTHSFLPTSWCGTSLVSVSMEEERVL